MKIRRYHIVKNIPTTIYNNFDTKKQSKYLSIET